MRRTENSRFLAFREADPPDTPDDETFIEDVLAQAGYTFGTAPTVATLAQHIEGTTPPLGKLATDYSMGRDALALRVDANLNTRIWAGTSFEDRLAHDVGVMRQDLVKSIENSLMQQESFEDFRARLLSDLGIDAEEPAGALRKFETEVMGEAKLGWNEALIEANEGEDTALVWRARLDERTTPGCLARHGALIYDDLDGEVPWLHFGCRCEVIVIPDPQSADSETAAAGQAILEQMAQEREEWGGDVADRELESQRKPSRFAAFREAYSEELHPRDEHGRWTTGGGATHDPQTETAPFKAWFKDSGVTDDAGRPRLMFHSTNAGDLESFKPYTHFGTAQAANDRFAALRDFSTDVVQRDPGAFQITPVYLSVQNPLRMPDLANLDAQTMLPFDQAQAEFEDKYPDAEYRAHLEDTGEAPRPASWESESDLSEWLYRNDVITQDEFWDVQESPIKAMKLLEKKGHDGIVYDNIIEDPGHDSYIVFRPEQVKSALGNRGTFSPHSPKITESDSDGFLEADFDPSLHPRDETGKFTDAGGGKIDTPEFKAWFGNSKVVDTAGQPLVVYHGTTAAEDFPTFDMERGFGAHFGTMAQANDERFTGRNGERPSRILPVHLSIEHPLQMADLNLWEPSSIMAELERIAVTKDYPQLTPEAVNTIDDLRSEQWQHGVQAQWRAIRGGLEALGFDGIRYGNANEGEARTGAGYGTAWIAFRPEQIKSIWNKGPFDPHNPKIIEAWREAEWNPEDHPRVPAGSSGGGEFVSDGNVGAIPSGEYHQRSVDIGRRIRAGELVSDEELKTLSKTDAVAMRRLQGEYKPRRLPEQSAPLTVVRRIGVLEQVDGKFTNTDDDDEFLYHVTTASGARRILSSGVLSPGQVPTMDAGAYRNYSKGKVFFGPRSSVLFWRDRIEEHLESQERKVKLVVLRFPKNAVPQAQVDEIGMRDSHRPSFFATQPIRFAGQHEAEFHAVPLAFHESWDEEDHPREPAGSPEGGQFASAGSFAPSGEREPWQMTRQEFVNPYAAAVKPGYTKLFTMTDPENIASIRKEGLLASKASGREAPKGMLWATHGPTDYSKDNALVEFQVPAEVATRGTVNARLDERTGRRVPDQVMLPLDVPPEDILATHIPWKYPDQSEVEDQRVRSDVVRGRGTTAAKAHRMYVEDALVAGKSVPDDVLRDYPELRHKQRESVRPSRFQSFREASC